MKDIKNVIHKWVWPILIVFCIIGLFYPVIGIGALICMMAPIIVAFFKGRLWCGSFCPRGSFNDVVVSKVSRKSKIPYLLTTGWFKTIFLILVMGAFTIQIIFAWGSITSIGVVFVRMIIITTILSILLGIIYNYRTWCVICPMGTMAGFVSKIKAINKKINHVSFEQNKCVNCKICSKNCPIGIDVIKYKDHGKVTNSDCIKCEVCVSKCPKSALKYTNDPQ